MDRNRNRNKKIHFWSIYICFLLIAICISDVNLLRTKSKPKPSTVSPLQETTIANANKSTNITSEDTATDNRHSQSQITSKILQIKTPPKIRKNVITELKRPVNSDIIVGKDVPKSAKIVLQCSASFPVQWIYSGQGTPEISTNTTFVQNKKKTKKRGQEDVGVGVFTATASLGLKGKMKETDTGEYICTGIQIQQQSQDSISYFIYVPGKSLFTVTQRTKKQKQAGAQKVKLRIAEGQKVLRIPCSVTNPDAIVTLQRRQREKGFITSTSLSTCPSEGEMKFNPKSGFDVSFQEFQDVPPSASAAGAGGHSYEYNYSYVCIADLNGSAQILEFTLERLPAPTRRESFQDIERVENDSLELELGDEDVQSDFEFNRYLIFQERNEEACNQFPNPCGPNSRCTIIRGTNLPRCQCLPLYLGRPPNCSPECVLNLDCPRSMACRDNNCENPCDNFPCALNATCKVVDHNPICSCPPGYSGNPNKHGKCGRTRSPSLQYFPTPTRSQTRTRPATASVYPYPAPVEGEGESNEDSNSNSNSESRESEHDSHFKYGEPQTEKQFYGYLFQNRFPCSPWPCGPNSDCRPVGENAHCTCAAGYAGQPPNCRRPDCRRNADCRGDEACVDSLCQNPCSIGKRRCGPPAKCVVANHSPKCVIMGGSAGQNQNQNQNDQNNQNQGQFPESPSASQNPNLPQSTPGGMRPGYPEARPTPRPESPSGIFDNRPIPRPPTSDNNNSGPGPVSESGSSGSPCQNSPCGRNAICSFRNSTIGCKCPAQLSGVGSDPYVECKPSSDPCDVCGPHSECFVKKNRPPVCSCLQGTVGSPPNCRENYCQYNPDCGDHQHCFRGRCEDPCQRANCGQNNAICRPMRHHAVCACLNAPDRDPLYGCEAVFEDY